MSVEIQVKCVVALLIYIGNISGNTGQNATELPTGLCMPYGNTDHLITIAGVVIKPLSGLSF